MKEFSLKDFTLDNPPNDRPILDYRYENASFYGPPWDCFQKTWEEHYFFNLGLISFNLHHDDVKNHFSLNVLQRNKFRFDQNVQDQIDKAKKEVEEKNRPMLEWYEKEIEIRKCLIFLQKYYEVELKPKSSEDSSSLTSSSLSAEDKNL